LSSARRILLAAYVVYGVLLAWIILWKLQLPYVGGGAQREIKLVPYLAAGSAGGSDPLEVAANIALFIPFGAFLALFAPSRRWWSQAAMLAGVSIGLEVAQYVLATGRSDVTDVLDNVLGGMIGVGILTLTRRNSQDRADAAAGRALVICTCFAVLAMVLILLSPLRFHDPHR